MGVGAAAARVPGLGLTARVPVKLRPARSRRRVASEESSRSADDPGDRLVGTKLLSEAVTVVAAIHCRCDSALAGPTEARPSRTTRSSRPSKAARCWACDPPRPSAAHRALGRSCRSSCTPRTHLHAQGLFFHAPDRSLPCPPGGLLLQRHARSLPLPRPSPSANHLRRAPPHALHSLAEGRGPRASARECG